MKPPVVHVININPEVMVDWIHPTNRKDAIESRKQRIHSVVNQSKAFGLSVRFWEGEVQSKIPHTNISRTFKKVVRWAKEKKLPSITIAEDDFVFTSPNSWQHYLDQAPREYDLYLGGLYAGQLKENRIINGYSGHTLVTVHNRFYDFFLSADEKDHLDRWLGNYAFEKKYYVCLPFVVMQMGGFSHNHRKNLSYESYHSEWKYLTD